MTSETHTHTHIHTYMTKYFGYPSLLLLQQLFVQKDIASFAYCNFVLGPCTFKKKNVVDLIIIIPFAEEIVGIDCVWIVSLLVSLP
eukprot:m.85152 g.85152  ORF g.85152 m.85152 type:complete len:86 (-) comp8731_c0_seq1:2376-2633(-)